VSPSLRRELGALGPWLLLTLVGWVGGVWLHQAPEGAPPRLEGWQVRFPTLSVPEQRFYRTLRDAVMELESRRGTHGAWAPVDELAADEVPPFAPDGLDAPLRWELRRVGPYAAYLGEPEAADAARWLVLFIEPEAGALRTPGEAPPPVDEEHHTLSDGTALHVTVWRQPAQARLPEGVPAFPVADGWTQVLGR
jgi:hypothetical protein